jgi:hypothetical protein
MITSLLKPPVEVGRIYLPESGSNDGLVDFGTFDFDFLSMPIHIHPASQRTDASPLDLIKLRE